VSAHICHSREDFHCPCQAPVVLKSAKHRAGRPLPVEESELGGLLGRYFYDMKSMTDDHLGRATRTLFSPWKSFMPEVPKVAQVSTSSSADPNDGIQGWKRRRSTTPAPHRPHRARPPAAPRPGAN
jgi:hypothetical protein